MSKYEPLWRYAAQCGMKSFTLRFAEIEQIAGIPIDHSFLRYKGELAAYGYRVGKISIKAQTVAFEKLPQTLVLYVHGKGGSADEAAHYQPLFPSCRVIGLDYTAVTPLEAEAEFPAALQQLTEPHDPVVLIANSIGAYFSLCALPQERIERAYLISPIVDMERLICDMMQWANVTEAELCAQKTIETAFGETLSWDYLCYVRSHPVHWRVPSKILYGDQDNLTSKATISAFAEATSAKLTIMEGGEHWFHTDTQMKYLDQWIQEQ